MERYVICLLKHLLAALCHLYVVRQLFCVRIKGDYLHIKSEGCLLCHKASDISHSDETQGLSV